MGPLTHHEIVKRSIATSHSEMAGIMGRQREWLDFVGYWRADDYRAGVAGLPDNVLGDFHYQSLPRCIGVIRLLTGEILTVMETDPSKASFLTQLACHYLTDAPWIGHRLEGFFPNDPVQARKIHDYTEGRTDQFIEQWLAGKIPSGPGGYWAGFWNSLFQADAKVGELIRHVNDHEVFASLVKENVDSCFKGYACFLDYLDFRRKNRIPDAAIACARTLFASPDARIYADSSPVCQWNAQAMAFHLGATHLAKAEGFLSSQKDNSRILLILSDRATGVEIDRGKLILAAREEDMGCLADLLFDTLETDFGASLAREQAAQWPGHYFLGWSGKKIRNEILTREFFDQYKAATRENRFRTDEEMAAPGISSGEAGTWKKFQQASGDFHRRFHAAR
ncbi:MAG: hypothetical protein PHV34_04255 [Verrucomicrobiae bacterium]|nr:hypothetical protein [Verrucomicrobiae bacterium]